MTTFSQQEKERLRKQRKRQQDYRAKQKENRRPGRDDVARAVLVHVLQRFSNNQRSAEFEKFIDLILIKLTDLGFDESASFEVIDDLIVKYTKGSWDFRRKPHLRQPHPDEGDPNLY